MISYERAKPSPEKRTVPAQTFAHLPVKETIVIEPDEVKAEPQAFEKIGEERTFEVDVVPPKLFKREIVRPKYQRKAEPSEAPVVAPRQREWCRAATPRPDCSRGLRSPSTSITPHFFVWSRCRHGGARPCLAKAWSSGFASPLTRSSRFINICSLACSREVTCRPTIIPSPGLSKERYVGDAGREGVLLSLSAGRFG